MAQLDMIDGRVVEGLASIRAIGESGPGGRARKTRGSAAIAMSPCWPCGRWTSARRASGSTKGSATRSPSSRRSAATSSSRPKPSSPGRPGAGTKPSGRVARRSATRARAGSTRWPQWALGYVSASRGRRREAEEHLLPARPSAVHAERLDVLLPAQWGLAEAALHAGRSRTAPRSSRRGAPAGPRAG